jgi:spore germination cell wall hydrolase CwlJ-like protein
MPVNPRDPIDELKRLSMMIQNALVCLALNIYHEDSGEPIQGQVAIAMVTMKHASSDAESTCDVIYYRKQFT